MMLPSEERMLDCIMSDAHTEELMVRGTLETSPYASSTSGRLLFGRIRIIYFNSHPYLKSVPTKSRLYRWSLESGGN